MPIHEFRCPEHGNIEKKFSFNDEVPVTILCPLVVCDKITCGLTAKKIISKPGAVLVEGGTGAGRLS